MSDASSKDAAFEAPIEDEEGFAARFPPEAFSEIAASLGLPPEPDVLSGLQRSLLGSLYFFYAVSSGDTLSRPEWISGLAELRDASQAFLKSLEYAWGLVTVASLGDDYPLFDPKFRKTVEAIAQRADAKIEQLRSQQPGKGGRPRKDEFWQLASDLTPIYQRWTNSEPKRPEWVGGSKYRGEFYDFVVAVAACLRANMCDPMVLENLPKTPSAIGDGLRTRWPLERT